MDVLVPTGRVTRIRSVGIACLVATAATAVVVVAGCGGSNVLEASQALTRCLKRHGIADAESLPEYSTAERAFPSLLGVRGLVAPRGISHEDYAAALAACGHAGAAAPKPVTNPAVRQKVYEVRACTERNGYKLPQPNFAGPGPVVDPAGIDTTSTHWLATALGCATNPDVTKAMLEACVGYKALGPTGRRDDEFERKYIQLPGCLKRITGSLP
jgi:hypothetical protein